MKYVVIVSGQTKNVEAAQFFCEGRMVVFALATPEPRTNQYAGGFSCETRKPTPVAAYPMEFVESIETDAVTQAPKPNES